ncbi:helix-turn-helix domain-containing protein [Streptomyces sp. NPDC059072]|uniref:helix-turn-helix domain-containing protein n=1 Tax=Streptomyces sp. NPDC059072 TaxID=3346715 RepID=UPI0036B72F41
MSDQVRATDGTGDARAQLFAEMRRIKEVSQLSFGRLADRTHYSRSSWERFLNGKQLPTVVAVEQLASAAGTDPEPLLALLSRATAPAASRPTTPSASAAPRADAVTEEGETAVGSTAGDGNADDEKADAGKADDAAADASSPDPKSDGWRRRFAVIGYVAAGALMGSVATGLIFSSAMADRGTPSTAGGAPEDKKKADPTTALVPRADDIRLKCKSDTCLRHDPQAMDCHWDATTAKSTFLRGMSIQLRYSAACQSVWGRIEGGAVGDKVIIKDARGTELEALIRFEHDSYTKMLAVSAETPLESMSVCGAFPAEKQIQCAPEGAVQLP